MKYLIFTLCLIPQLIFANDLSSASKNISKFEVCVSTEDSKKIALYALKSKRFKKVNIKVTNETSHQIKAITSTGSMGIAFGYDITIDLTKININKSELKLSLSGRDDRPPGKFYDFNSEYFKAEYMKIYDRWPSKTKCKK